MCLLVSLFIFAVGWRSVCFVFLLLLLFLLLPFFPRGKGYFNVLLVRVTDSSLTGQSMTLHL